LKKAWGEQMEDATRIGTERPSRNETCSPSCEKVEYANHAIDVVLHGADRWRQKNAVVADDKVTNRERGIEQLEQRREARHHGTRRAVTMVRRGSRPRPVVGPSSRQAAGVQQELRPLATSHP